MYSTLRRPEEKIAEFVNLTAVRGHELCQGNGEASGPVERWELTQDFRISSLPYSTVVWDRFALRMPFC